MRDAAVILDCLLNSRCGFLQVFEVHGWMELDVGIEGQKPRLCYCGYLRCVLEVKKDEPCPLTVVFCKIGIQASNRQEWIQWS